MTEERGTPAPWAAHSLQAGVVKRARAKLKGSADNVARSYGDLTLTHVGHQFLAYWAEVRGDKPVPMAEDINPAKITELLPYMRYMHWDGGRLVHRVFGSALVEASGADLTGTDMFDFVPPLRREEDRARLRMLHTHPCGLVALTESLNLAGEAVLAEMTFLPVKCADGQPDRIIGTIMLRTPFTSYEAANVRRPDENSIHEVRARIFMDTGGGVPREADDVST